MPALLSLRQLSYLIAVAERLNFTQAAADCFVTQSTLSAGLKELESALNVQLVERERHRVTMTPVGLEVVKRAQTLLALAEDLAGFATSAADPMSGTIRLGVIPTIAPFLLPTVLPEMRRHYPKLQFALREDLTTNLLERLDKGQLDFALIALPFETGNLMVKELFSEELWLVTPQGEKMPRKMDISRINADRLLLLEEGHCLRGHTLSGCGLMPGASHGLEATSLFTLIQMIEENMGIGLLPEMTLRAGLLKNTSLLAQPFASPAPKRHIALLARPSTSRGEAFNILSQTIVELHRKEQSYKLSSGSRHSKK